MGREYVGIELKPSYFREAVKNLREAERRRDEVSIFDMMEDADEHND